MKKNAILLVVMFFMSCSSMRIIESGIYKWKHTEPYHEYVLTLNKNHTFHLIEIPFEISCEGSWNYLDQRTIKISCFEPKSATELITRGYMHERTRVIKVKRNSILKMPVENNVKRKYVILKKVKEK